MESTVTAIVVEGRVPHTSRHILEATAKKTNSLLGTNAETTRKVSRTSSGVMVGSELVRGLAHAAQLQKTQLRRVTVAGF